MACIRTRSHNPSGRLQGTCGILGLLRMLLALWLGAWPPLRLLWSQVGHLPPADPFSPQVSWTGGRPATLLLLLALASPGLGDTSPSHPTQPRTPSDPIHSKNINFPLTSNRSPHTSPHPIPRHGTRPGPQPGRLPLL